VWEIGEFVMLNDAELLKGKV